MKLNNAQDAVKEAIEGGYNAGKTRTPAKIFESGRIIDQELWDDIDRRFKEAYIYPSVFTDPLFWQALGKARGWEMEDWICDYCGDNKRQQKGMSGHDPDCVGRDTTEPKYHAHIWFETRMSNGDEQAFWQSLS